MQQENWESLVFGPVYDFPKQFQASSSLSRREVKLSSSLRLKDSLETTL